jgi:hypothetical protein
MISCPSQLERSVRRSPHCAADNSLASAFAHVEIAMAALVDRHEIFFF